MMKKIIAIHQPNYLPWLGFFNKIKNCDTFVILDSVKYTKNSAINRNKIKGPNGPIYLTIPIAREYYSQIIANTKLPSDERWADKHSKSLEFNYSKSPFFKSYPDFIKKTYNNLPQELAQFNISIIKYLLKAFSINTEIVKSSDLGMADDLKSTDLLINIVKKLNGTGYLSGQGGKRYMEEDKFKNEGISLEYQEFKHPVYKQQFGQFEPNLSAIDLLFNAGEASKDLI